MKCPACADEDMVQVDIHSLVIDRCPACGGIALDKGETDMIDSLGLAHIIEQGVAAAHVKRVSIAYCHECKCDMLALRGAGDIEYDWCAQCERLFFDRGELTAMDIFVDA